MDSRMGELVCSFLSLQEIEQSKRLSSRVTSWSMCSVLYHHFQKMYISLRDCLDVLQYNKDPCLESAPTG